MMDVHDDESVDDGTVGLDGRNTPPLTRAVNKRNHLDGRVPTKKNVKRRLFDDVHTEERHKDATDIDSDDDGNQNDTVRQLEEDNDYGRNEEEVLKLKVRPTIDRFVYGDQILDLRCSLPGFEGASVMLTNVYNTFVYIVKLKNTLLTLQNRKLTIQLRAVEHHLRRLEEDKYFDAHVHLPRIVESLFSMWDYRNNPIYINQLKPVSCVLNRKRLMDNITFRSMEATSKNDSNYIELMFNNPFRFIFVGCSSRGGQHNKNVVNPFPFFGEYINKAVDDMYDVLYELVTKEIRRAKKELAQRDRQRSETDSGERGADGPTATAVNHHIGGLHSMEMFSIAKQTRNANATDDERLHKYLRSINGPLDRRENVDILVTSGNSGKKSSIDSSKMRYLTVEKNKEITDAKGTLKIVETDVTEDAVYLSSYIRCRVLMLDQPAFGMQIYTRHAIKLMTIDDRLVKFNEFEENV